MDVSVVHATYHQQKQSFRPYKIYTFHDMRAKHQPKKDELNKAKPESFKRKRMESIPVVGANVKQQQILWRVECENLKKKLLYKLFSMYLYFVCFLG